MTHRDFKMILGFDGQTNRAYDCLRREVRQYMEDRNIDQKAAVSDEEWKELMD